MLSKSKSALAAANPVRSQRSLLRGQRRWIVLTAFSALALLAALLAAPPLSGQNTRVIQFNLADMVRDAGTIVHGRVLSVAFEVHPKYRGLQTAVVNIEIIEMLKGQSSAPYSFRQYMLNPQEAAAVRLQYKPGTEFLLLMLPPHHETGLTSPVGMEQSQFRVARDAQGNRVVANSYNNGGIFRGMDPATNSKLQSLGPQARTTLTQHRGGPIRYDDLKAIILALAAN